MTAGEYRKKMTREVARAAERAEAAIRDFRDESKTAKQRIGALAGAGALRDAGDVDYALRVAADRAEPAELRASAIGYLAPLLAAKPKATQFLIKRLADPDEALEVRGAAASALKLGAFHARSFADHRADYVDALRVAADAEHATLRDSALDVLAREKDAPTLRKLEHGLREPARAVVDPEKALQLLSYDTKRNLRELLVDIVRKPPSPGARHQALRNLATDDTSRPLFARMVRDKTEDREARLIAMSALQVIDPGGLGKLATKVAADDSDDEEVRGACFTAMATLEPTATRPTLRKAAVKLAEKADSRAARAAAKLYLNTPED